MSVGMAIAERWLAKHFNRPGFELFDYNVYALCGDGDMMEGVSQRSRLARRPPEARTCAGSTTATTSRSKATPISPSATMSATRFLGYGWNVTHVGDANDLDDLRGASRLPRARTTGRR